MSQTRVDRIERATFAEVGEFLGQEWDAKEKISAVLQVPGKRSRCP